MQPSENRLAPHEDRLNALWASMVRTVGIHTVNVLIERAIFEASQQHPELALIKRTDEGLEFEAVEKVYADRPESEVSAAFSDLSSHLLLILTRLLGRKMASQLSEELQAKTDSESSGGSSEDTAQ